MTDAYTIVEVDASQPEHAEIIHAFNARFPGDFLPLQPRHLLRGYWWLVTCGIQVVGFAGMVPFDPCPLTGYLKRAAVLPAHRGKGLQGRLMAARLEKARTATDWTQIVSECAVGNVASANNFIRAGFLLFEPERPREKETLFWRRAVGTG